MVHRRAAHSFRLATAAAVCGWIGAEGQTLARSPRITTQLRFLKTLTSCLRGIFFFFLVVDEEGCVVLCRDSGRR